MFSVLSRWVCLYFFELCANMSFLVDRRSRDHNTHHRIQRGIGDVQKFEL